MNIFWHEIKSYRKSTLIWIISITGVIILMLSMYTSLAKEMDSFNKIIDAMPDVLKKAIGFSDNSFLSVIGFYTFGFMYVTLCGAIQAMNLGLSIISREAREKTADFLLTKPVTRNNIMTSKLLAVLSSLIVTNIIYYLAAYSMMTIVSTAEFSFKLFSIITISLFFIQLVFVSLGVIISVVVSKIKSVLSISLGIVFALFFIGMFGSTIGDGALNYLSPFKYFEALYIIKNGCYDTQYLIVAVVFIIASIISSYMIYLKKNIHSV